MFGFPISKTGIDYRYLGKSSKYACSTSSLRSDHSNQASLPCNLNRWWSIMAWDCKNLVQRKLCWFAQNIKSGIPKFTCIQCDADVGFAQTKLMEFDKFLRSTLTKEVGVLWLTVLPQSIKSREQNRNKSFFPVPGLFSSVCDSDLAKVQQELKSNTKLTVQIACSPVEEGKTVPPIYAVRTLFFFGKPMWQLWKELCWQSEAENASASSSSTAQLSLQKWINGLAKCVCCWVKTLIIWINVR